MKKLILSLLIILSLTVLIAADIETLVKDGKAHYNVQNYKTAYDNFKAAMKINPNHTEAMSWYWKMKKEHDVSDLKDSGRSITVENTSAKPIEKKDSTPVEKKEEPKNENRTNVRADKPRETRPSSLTQIYHYQDNTKISELNQKLSNIEKSIENIKINKEQPNDNIKSSINLFPSLSALAASGSWIFYLLLSMILFFLIVLIMILKGKKKKYQAFAAAAPSSFPANANGLMTFQTNPTLLNPSVSGANPMRADQFTSNIIVSKKNNPIVPIDQTIKEYTKPETFVKGYVYLLDKKYNRGENTKRVRTLSHEIGSILQLPPEEMTELRLTATLRDIGFLMISEHIILKPDLLSDLEKMEVLKHPQHSVDIISAMNLPEKVIQSILHHHERCDGSGYPYGLICEEIPMYSRIVGIAESYVSLTTQKPYKPVLTPEQALDIIIKERNLFDPKVIDALAVTIENAD